jgi:YD repeat-containing protein
MLDLKNAGTLGHGLQVGDYFEFTMQRLSSAGALGVELFDSDQMRQGSGDGAGNSSLQAWNQVGCVPISIDASGRFTQFDWNEPHRLGVHFTSADGHFDTFAYYLDGQYIASWISRTNNTSLDKIGVFCQSRREGCRFSFSDLKVFLRIAK